MANVSLKERVAALEKIVDELKETTQYTPRPKDWRRTIGMFGDDEVMKRIFDNALQYREADRARARKRFAKQRKRKT